MFHLKCFNNMGTLKKDGKGALCVCVCVYVSNAEKIKSRNGYN